MKKAVLAFPYLPFDKQIRKRKTSTSAWLSPVDMTGNTPGTAFSLAEQLCERQAAETEGRIHVRTALPHCRQTKSYRLTKGQLLYEPRGREDSVLKSWKVTMAKADGSYVIPGKIVRRKTGLPTFVTESRMPMLARFTLRQLENGELHLFLEVEERTEDGTATWTVSDYRRVVGDLTDEQMQVFGEIYRSASAS